VHKIMKGLNSADMSLQEPWKYDSSVAPAAGRSGDRITADAYRMPAAALPELYEARVNDQGVIVPGIPIPSSSPLFVRIVAAHVVAGFVCAFAGTFSVRSCPRLQPD
jgi:hypothetical protein